jgi:hypothetical protein
MKRFLFLVIARGLLGLLIVGCVIYAGWQHRPTLIILPLAAAFTLAYISGKWPSWKRALPGWGIGKLIGSVLASFVVQCIVVSVFFVIGRGIGSLFGHSVNAGEALAQSDWLLAGAVAVIGALGGLMVTTPEAQLGMMRGQNRDEPNTFDSEDLK